MADNPTQLDITNMIQTTGNTDISDLSNELSGTLMSTNKDDGFFSSLGNIANKFSESLSNPGVYEALMMHQAAKGGGDFTDILLAGVKARKETTENLFKSAYNNARLQQSQTMTEYYKGKMNEPPKVQSPKIVTGDDGLKYKVNPDGSTERLFPGMEKVTTQTDTGPFPTDFNLNNVTKAARNYILGTYFPNAKKTDNAFMNQLNALSTQIANEVAPLIKDLGLNEALRQVANKYETAGAFKKGVAESGQGYFDGPAQDRIPPSIDLSILNRPNELEQLIQANMAANPGLSREEVVGEIMKIFNAQNNQ
tara:strand:+ start:377 stop:1303 length:927 start_codon:yes stop_codon:yes gene_type:complete